MLGIWVSLVGLMCRVDEVEDVTDGIMLMEVWRAKCGAWRCAFNLLVQPERPGRGLSLNGELYLMHGICMGMMCFPD